MANDSFTQLTPAQAAAVDRFWAEQAPELAAAASSALPWSGGLDRREALATAAAAARSKQGFLSKKTFDDILEWGFGRRSNLGRRQIKTATKEAFALYGKGDQAGALRRLRDLPGIGVSRASKILALADQDNLGIYDSHAAAALEPIRDGAKPLVAVPPGMSKSVRGVRPVSQDRLNEDFPKYTAVLRRLLENAQKDKRYGTAFKRVADIERALFAKHRQGASAPPPTQAITRTTAEPAPFPSMTRASAQAAFIGAAMGAIQDIGPLRRGEIDLRTAGKHRLRDGFGSGVRVFAEGAAQRFGKAKTGKVAAAQSGARLAGVTIVIGVVNEGPALIRGDLHPRDFVENRVLDVGEAGTSKVLAQGVVVALIAAPFEAPAVVIATAGLGMGFIGMAAARPIRRRVARAQQRRAERRGVLTPLEAGETSDEEIRKRLEEIANQADEKDLRLAAEFEERLAEAPQGWLPPAEHRHSISEAVLEKCLGITPTQGRGLDDSQRLELVSCWFAGNEDQIPYEEWGLIRPAWL